MPQFQQCHFHKGSNSIDINGIILCLSTRVKNVGKGLEKTLSVLAIFTAGTTTSQRAVENHCLLETAEENY